MINKELNIYCACISTGRPENVNSLEKRTGLNFTYYTRAGESKKYIAAGAKNVIEVDGNICMARNKAIHDARGLICLQISDDYQYTTIIIGNKEPFKRQRIPFIDALKFMLSNFSGVQKCNLAGVSITDSIFHYKGIPISINQLVVNDCILVRNGIQYDVNADLKEDYDMFVTQVRTGYRVMRFDCIQMRFPHRQNKGGANGYRTDEKERRCNAYVIFKHNGIIEPHKTRKNQIQINKRKLYEKN